jgi:sulfur-oxidizing protein SoxY
MAEPVDRRRVLLGSVGFAAGAAMISSVLPSSRAGATPQAMQEAIRAIVGEAVPRRGRITLDVPPLVENGNVVPLTVSVDSPMTETDYVKAVHVVNEKNPQPNMFSARLGPRAGRARLSTRIKLADSQRIVALAEMSDGSFWTETADVVVTLAACVEDIN